MALPTSVPSKSPPPLRASIFSFGLRDDEGEDGEEELQEPGTSDSHIRHHARSSISSTSSSQPHYTSSLPPWSPSDLTSALEQVRVQTSFIDVFTAPLYKQLARFAPELGHFYIRCERNGGVWKEVGRELGRVREESEREAKEEAENAKESENEEKIDVRVVKEDMEIETRRGSGTETATDMISPGMSDFSFTTDLDVNGNGHGRRRTSLESSTSTSTALSSVSAGMASTCDDDDDVDGEEEYHSGHEDGEEECVECSFSSTDTAQAQGISGSPNRTFVTSVLASTSTSASPGPGPGPSTALFRHVRNYSTSSSLSRSSYYTARSSAYSGSGSGSGSGSEASSRRGSSLGDVTMQPVSQPLSLSQSQSQSQVRSQAQPGVGVLKRDFTFGVHPVPSATTNPFTSPTASSMPISPLTQTSTWHSNSNSTASTSTSTSTSTSISASEKSQILYHVHPLSPPAHMHTRAHHSAEYRVPLGIEAMRAAYRASSRKRALASEYYGPAEVDTEGESGCECGECGYAYAYPVPGPGPGLGYWEFPYRRRSVGPGSVLFAHGAGAKSKPRVLTPGGGGGGGGGATLSSGGAGLGHVPTRSLLVRESS